MLDACIEAAGLWGDRLFPAVNKVGRVWGEGITEKVVWWVVRDSAGAIATERLPPHDLRRTCAKLCRATGGELEQILMLLGHASVQTTERYLGTRQNLAEAVNDKLELVET